MKIIAKIGLYLKLESLDSAPKEVDANLYLLLRTWFKMQSITISLKLHRQLKDEGNRESSSC